MLIKKVVALISKLPLFFVVIPELYNAASYLFATSSQFTTFHIALR